MTNLAEKGQLSEDDFVSVASATQANIDLAIRCSKRMESKIFEARGKIARIRALGLPTDTEDQELAGLLRGLEVLKVLLAKLTAPLASEDMGPR